MKPITISRTDFTPITYLKWDGRYLTNRLGIKLKCIKKAGKLRLYVGETISMDGTPNDKEYFIVGGGRTSQVLRYNHEITRGAVTAIVRFLHDLSLKETRL